ncbi:hypothetical protein HDU85_002282 [Gaertneriomyces sp. JEL0708]|nr:hypothetical protein HDU85_002282 [Gaertneriomyces sp. JEL0708]
MSDKPKVFLARPLPPAAQKRIEGIPSISLTQNTASHPLPRAELLAQIRGTHALLCMLTEKVDAELLDAAGPQLRTVSTVSVGYDHIDVNECRKRGVSVGNTPDVLTDATAELTMGLLLATCRRFGEGLRAPKSGEWSTWHPTWLCGQQVSGKVVGLVGFGRIGFAVAERLVPFRVSKLIYTCPTPKPEMETRLNVPVMHAPLDDLLRQSDIVVIACALTPETRHLFNARTFALMKPTALLINTARGGIIHQPDLVAALRNGTIAAAGLDVTDPEPLPIDSDLLQLDNCLVLPHIGSATVETREAMADMAIENLLRGLEGQEMLAEVK